MVPVTFTPTVCHDAVMTISPEESNDALAGVVPAYTAGDIRKLLDERVVGQESAKAALSHLLAMHLTWFRRPDPLHPAPNALLIGPTGVGKTHTIETAAERLRVPLTVVDGTRLMATGGAGKLKFDDVFEELVASAERLIARTEAMTKTTPLELARRGIIFIDEFDKLRLDARFPLNSNFVLQRTLLQILEGSRVPVRLNPSRSPEKATETLDTRGILFVASGAFEGIREEWIRAKRPQEITRQGLPPDVVIPPDIYNFGFLPELVARLPVFIHYAELTTDNLIAILNNPHVDPVTVYKTYLKELNVDLKLSDAAKRFFAERAALLKMGARGLHQVLFPALMALSERALENPPNVLEVDERLAARLYGEGR